MMNADALRESAPKPEMTQTESILLLSMKLIAVIFLKFSVKPSP